MNVESYIRNYLRSTYLSASHDWPHIELVLKHAMALQSIYGGDREVVTAAALLHDLGRSEAQLHGRASAESSAQIAERVLSVSDFPPEKIAVTILAISEHDQPELRPSTLEGRILKDADFVAGFGAIGVLRAAMWTGESGQDLAAFMQRVNQKMPERMKSLEFPASRAYAQKAYIFVRLFLEELSSQEQQSPEISLPPASPYLVIEGISGSGKSTQAQLLAGALRDAGQEVVVIQEPSPWYHMARTKLAVDRFETDIQLLLLLAGRIKETSGIIALESRAGRTVVSDRSYLSSLVYQSQGHLLSPSGIAYLHAHCPQPTHIIILDVEPEIALARIEERIGALGLPKGEHETIDRLSVDRSKFVALKEIFPFATLINTSYLSVQDVHQQVLSLIRQAPVY